MLPVGLLFLMLALINSTPISDWPFVITPNSVVSILIKVAEILVFVTSTASAFQLIIVDANDQPIPLQGLNFAYEGLFGPGKAIVSVFAARHLRRFKVTVIFIPLTCTMAPFAHNVLTVHPRTTPSLPVTVPIARDYNVSDSGSALQVQDPGINIKAATSAGLYSSISDAGMVNRGVVVVSPTGNASFDSFETLGFSGECIDQTPEVVLSNSTSACQYSLSGGPGLCQQGALWNSSADLSFIAAGPFIEYTQQFLNWRYIVNANGNIIAGQCIIYAAIHEYEDSLEGGVLSENLVNEWHNSTANFSEANVSVDDSEYFLLAKNESDPASFFIYRNNSVLAIQNFLADEHTGTIVARDGQTLYTSNGSPETIQARFNATTKGLLETQNDDLHRALSNAVRLNDAHGATAPGVASESVEYFHVRWLWMIEPTLISSLPLFILTWVIWLSKARGLARSRLDLLTSLSIALPTADRSELDRRFGTDSLRQVASDVNVQLQSGFLRLQDVSENVSQGRFGRFREIMRGQQEPKLPAPVQMIDGRSRRHSASAAIIHIRKEA